jgi:DNA-binding transcriptional regulator YiaG
MTHSELRALRHELKLTQAGLAHALGCSRGTISRWELKSGSYPVSHMAANLVRLLAEKQALDTARPMR